MAPPRKCKTPKATMDRSHGVAQCPGLPHWARWRRFAGGSSLAFQGGPGMPDFALRALGRALAAAMLLAATGPLSAATPPREAESFRIGSEGALCEAQGEMLGDARASVFDRKWALLCADVDRPIGTAFSWKGASEIGARIGRGREALLDCGEPV